jgi:hypothetical protein
MTRALAVLVALAAACGGNVRAYPRWRFAGDPAPSIEAGCVLGRAFVRMSGKTGVGMTVELRSRGDCLVRFARAELVMDGVRAPATLPADLALRGRSLVYVWLPFEFDNQQAWNAGLRTGTFEIDLDAAGAVTTWRIAADHTRPERFVPGTRRPL